MVTHNPNLAVVCDAEQIIHARFDRALDSAISYESGAIENTGLNEVVVTILEGTKPAFENRYAVTLFGQPQRRDAAAEAGADDEPVIVVRHQ